MRSYVRLPIKGGIAGLGLAVVLAGIGCSQDPQVAPENRRIVEGLMTATSARNAEWLEQNAALIAERRAGGQLSDAEADAFETILEAGRSGDWEEARRLAFRLGQAQRPTAEDRERPESRRIKMH